VLESFDEPILFITSPEPGAIRGPIVRLAIGKEIVDLCYEDIIDFDVPLIFFDVPLAGAVR
jgi:hypothetical protein